MIEFIETDIRSAIDLIEHTFNSHWEEVQEVAPLNPVYDVYYDLEDQNMLYSLVAMDGNELLGYVIFIIAKHHHHSGSIWASSDILYISPTHRGKGVCKEILSKAEESLREKGVEIILVSSRAHKDFGSLLGKIGYNPYEYSYFKDIGD